MKRSLRYTSTVMSLLVFAALLVSSAAAQDVTLTVASGWGQPGANSLADAWQEIITSFQTSHPNIKIEAVWGVNPNKLSTMIAGGAAPDVVGLGAQYVVPYGYSGQLLDLSDMLDRKGIAPDVFIPPAFAQLGYEGAQYGLPWMTNITFGLLRNKGLLDRSGIDSAKDVEFIDEVDAVQRKVTRFNSDGVPEQLGIIPEYRPNGDQPANSLTSWAWAFGGRWWDAETSTFTSAEPENVEALEWMADQYQQYAADLSVVGMDVGGFCNGRLALTFVHTFITSRVASTCAENGVDWAIGPQPVARNRGVKNPLWVSGPALVVPALSRSPEVQDAAYTFLAYATTSPQALEIMVRVGKALPGVVDPEIWEVVREDDLLATWANLLPGVQYSRPVVPNQRFWVTELRDRVNQVFKKELPAREALLMHQEQVTRDLAEYR